jgi:hypothetical protein
MKLLALPSTETLPDKVMRKFSHFCKIHIFFAKYSPGPCLQGVLAAWLVGNRNPVDSTDHKISVGALTLFLQSNSNDTLVKWQVNGWRKF